MIDADGNDDGTELPAAAGLVQVSGTVHFTFECLCIPDADTNRLARKVELDFEQILKQALRAIQTGPAPAVLVTASAARMHRYGADEINEMLTEMRESE